MRYAPFWFDAGQDPLNKKKGTYDRKEIDGVVIESWSYRLHPTGVGRVCAVLRSTEEWGAMACKMAIAVLAGGFLVGTFYREDGGTYEWWEFNVYRASQEGPVLGCSGVRSSELGMMPREVWGHASGE